MREPPALSEASILTTLHNYYGITATDLRFLPLGYDVDAGSYRVEHKEGKALFLKVRRGASGVTTHAFVRAVHDWGVPAVALILSQNGNWSVPVEEFLITLYPYIEGRSGIEVGLSPEQWRAFGAAVRRLHDFPFQPDGFPLPYETYLPQARGVQAVRSFLMSPPDPDPADQIGTDLAVFWESERNTIAELLRRAQEYGERMLQQHPHVAPCHGDLHVGNILVDTAGDIHLVDWDQPIMAPRERDLMFICGGGIWEGAVPPEGESAFFAGYGEITPDPVALAYYRCDWAVQDIGLFAEQVFHLPNQSAAARSEAADLFRGLFGPGGLVGRALNSYVDL